MTGLLFVCLPWIALFLFADWMDRRQARRRFIRHRLGLE